MLRVCRYAWVPEDEESTKLECPRTILPQQPLPSALHSQQQTPQASKPKHVSFARSHTLTSFDVPRTKSPPRPQQKERLIDCQPTTTPASTALASTQVEPRILVLGKCIFVHNATFCHLGKYND